MYLFCSHVVSFNISAINDTKSFSTAFSTVFLLSLSETLIKAIIASKWSLSSYIVAIRLHALILSSNILNHYGKQFSYNPVNISDLPVRLTNSNSPRMRDAGIISGFYCCNLLITSFLIVSITLSSISLPAIIKSFKVLKHLTPKS